MPLDTSIPLQAREFKLQDPLEVQQQVYSLRDMRARQQQHEMAAEEGRRKQRDEGTLADLYRQHYNDPAAMEAATARAGLGARIPGMQKAQADIAKTKAETGNADALMQKHGAEGMKLRLEVVANTMRGLADRPDLNHDMLRAALIDSSRQYPDMQGAAAQAYSTAPPPQLGQDALRQWIRTRGLTAEQHLKAMTPDIKYMNTGKQEVPVDMNAMTNPSPQALQRTTTPGEDQSAATTQRGQNLTFESSRLGRQQADQHFSATRGDANSAVTYQTDPQTGQTVALPTKPGAGGVAAREVTLNGAPLRGKPAHLTEDQGKATSWLERMKQAEKVIVASPESAQTATGGVRSTIAASLRSIPLVGSSGPVEGMANTINTTERQKVESAQEAWIAGLLRSDTGAAYRDMEKSDISRTFFPQTGDSQAHINQKREMRDGVMRAMQVRSGPGTDRMPPASKPIKKPGASEWGGNSGPTVSNW